MSDLLRDLHPPHTLIKECQLHISEEDWADMNEQFSEEGITEYLVELTEDTFLPYKEITEEEMEQSFKDLKNMNPFIEAMHQYPWDQFFTRYEYHTLDWFPAGPVKVYFKRCNTGLEAPDFFHQTNRWKCDSINSPSPVRVWDNPEFRRTLFKALWTLKFKKITSIELRRAITLRKYIASQFRPATAKAMYDWYCSPNGTVLDFSMGWGDRLTGAYASDRVTSYIGTDPNKRLHKGYQKQLVAYEKFVHGQKKFTIHDVPFEDLDITPYKNSVDLVFTSPPYFNIERYTGNGTRDNRDEDQSWVRYKKLEDWLEEFLFVSVKKSYDVLKSGGFLAINISDVYSQHQVHKICDPMNEYIKSLGMVPEKVIPMEMSKRPNSLSDGNGIFYEPIWVWKKL